MIQRISRTILVLFSMLALAPGIFAGDISSNYVVVTERNKVCMVNDIYNPMADFTEFKVTVADKDYFGCCAMCKEKLTSSSSFRIAIDPLTKEEVDKAEAFIVADKTDKGKTLYFKNKEHFEKFVAK